MRITFTPTKARCRSTAWSVEFWEGASTDVIVMLTTPVAAQPQGHPPSREAPDGRKVRTDATTHTHTHTAWAQPPRVPRPFVRLLPPKGEVALRKAPQLLDIAQGELISWLVPVLLRQCGDGQPRRGRKSVATIAGQLPHRPADPQRHSSSTASAPPAQPSPALSAQRRGEVCEQSGVGAAGLQTSSHESIQWQEPARLWGRVLPKCPEAHHNVSRKADDGPPCVCKVSSASRWGVGMHRPSFRPTSSRMTLDGEPPYSMAATAVLAISTRAAG